MQTQIQIPSIFETFRRLCITGDVDLVKNYYEFNKNQINISDQNDYLFKRICQSGHLIIIKYLLEIKPDIDISHDEEEAFCLASQEGHLHVVKFLLEIKPNINISADNDRAFRLSCLSGNFDLVNYLINIKPSIKNKFNILKIFYLV